ncbi:YraN family protein [Methylobacterium sp. NEAU 140]|uniref:YraN family protein n=1 Tax=Methylobacterium sp. NEAU 140 TaxID=3064945 RepID=UPI0027344B02|nr:YraN family protein [Methylobacterium sp. NEAU 140]MDP4023210.1 YraN family protein [Methylobacterium sp. NEAU 140]
MRREDAGLRRRAAHRRGHRAEWLALVALMLKGYRPLARRVSAAGGEIDLIVRRGGTLAFVEVKARARLDDAREAIDAAKRRRFSRAVRAWVGRHPWSAGLTLRADAVFLGGRAWPAHLPGAFEIEGL